MAACAQCGTSLPRGATACPECGTPVPRPARKPAARKAPPAKAPAKAAKPAAKPAAKATAAAKAAARPATRTARAAAPVEEPVEAPVEAPVEPAEPPEETAPAAAADPYDTQGAAPVGAPSDPPSAERPRAAAMWARYARGDWRGPAVTALLALAATVVLSALAATSAFVAPESGEIPILGEGSFGRWVRYTCATVGLAFGSSVGLRPVEEDGSITDAILGIGWRVGFVPLTVTLLSLVAFWLVARRSPRATDRAAHVLRTATVFALGVAFVTLFARETVDEVRYVVSPWRAVPWAFAAAAAVTWLATYELPERWRDWALATRAAAYGVGIGVAWGIALLVALAYQPPGDGSVDGGDATRGIASAVPYGVNLGAAAFGGLTSLHIRIPSLEERGFWPMWSPEVPTPFLLALLAPAVAVGLTVLYLRRRVPAAELPAACARTALPAALIWLALAVAGSLRVWVPAGLGFSGRLGVGATPSHAVLVALWFGAGGWLLAKLLNRRV